MRSRVLFCALLFRCVLVYGQRDNVKPKDCVIDLECEECLPEHMPLVTSQEALDGSVVVAHDHEITLSCKDGRFLLYPSLSVLRAKCEDNKYKLHDGTVRRLPELGCQESLFEDVLHHVSECGPPHVGRAYQYSDGGKHLAALCYDPDRAIPLHLHSARAGIRMRPHEHSRTPLSVLGNFNHMFDSKTRSDAEKLYSDDDKINKRLRETLKHERHSFAGQRLTSTKLLPASYFDDQDMRVSNFVSNRVAAWTSVAEGNWRHLTHDVSAFLRQESRAVVYAGTHGIGTTNSVPPSQLYLKPEGRFPIPRYLWTVLVDPIRQKAIALVALNDPYVTVSQIRDSVFCESLCGRVSWLQELHRNRNYETPLYGLVFCCSVQNITSIVNEMPTSILRNIPSGDEGLLLTVK